MNHGKDLLIEGIKKLNLNATERQIQQFMDYYNLLIETNKSMNLTAITELDEVMVKHFLDSLLIVKTLDISNIQNMIDVGTGAGFPAIPIKIMFPHIDMVLLDSLKKRILFLENVIEKLQLSKMKAVHGRAEDMGHQTEYREQFELCVSRAVANLSTLSEYCIPFVKTGGNFVSYKAADSIAEIKASEPAVTTLGGTVEKSSQCYLPCSNMERTLVVIHKTKKTPKKYPRKAGIPSKEPIK